MKRLFQNANHLLVPFFGLMILSGILWFWSEIDAAWEPSVLASHPEGVIPSDPGPMDDWQRKWWIQKVAKALWNGQEIAAGQSLDPYLAMDPGQMVDTLMADPRFGDMVLDFNLYFLGFPVDRVKLENGLYHNQAFSLPHVISAAQAVLKNGDYFSIFDLAQPIYFPNLTQKLPVLPTDAPNLKPSEVRQRHFDLMQSQLDEMIQQASSSPPVATSVLCSQFKDEVQDTLFVKNYLGLPTSVINLMTREKNWYRAGYDTCAKTAATPGDWVKVLTQIKVQNNKFYPKLAPFEADTIAATADVSKIAVLDLSDMGLDFKPSIFASNLLQTTLQNSSTNQNRRRAAYILKRFFCDDLTPINVTAPEFHAGNQHASDPACMACHYKLDPMGGFFKDIGAQFIDFSGQKQIRFDDGVRTPLQAYEANWRAQPESGQTWNIGYIRSTQNAKLNDYGETLQDLFALLRRAPEVRRCVVKRMFEYLVSEKQTVDGDYLDWLTENFNQTAQASGTSAAFKQTAKTILLSESFRASDAKSDQCYDHRPGAPLGSLAPCKISSILNKNCVHCHNSTLKDPYLDLQHWSLGPDGKYGFPHLDDNGAQLPRHETYQRIMDRLSSTDPDERMPRLRDDMPSTERQDLYRWANGQLNSAEVPQ